jgi:choline dehydrogenase
MGGQDIPSVVDSVGAVKGFERLRVVDASIIPEVPSTVTNLTVILIAERIFERAYSSKQGCDDFQSWLRVRAC